MTTRYVDERLDHEQPYTRIPLPRRNHEAKDWAKQCERLKDTCKWKEVGTDITVCELVVSSI